MIALAGAVVRETRDLRITCPHCHKLMCEGQVSVDMRVVCPQDVKKMFLKQAMMVYWKRLTAKHECEKLKEGAWLEPIQSYFAKLA